MTDSGQPGVRRVIDAATGVYLAGESLDMTALATDLGVGRATLYRWVGGREELLGLVLAEATGRTFDVADGRTRGHGAGRVLRTCERFMRLALDAEPLQILTAREPLLFLRLATAPGPVERAAAERVQFLLDTEIASGHLTVALSTDVLAEAIVRICDSHVYAHLLGGGEPRVATAVRLIKLLLRP